MPEGEELIQWDSLQDPVRIEREHAEAHRLNRETNTVININEGTVENSKILQVTNTQLQYTAKAPGSGKISPKQQEQEGHVSITPKSGKIPPIQTDEGNLPHLKPNMNEISPKEPNEVTDLVAMEEGARAQTPDKDTYSDSRKEYRRQGNENLQQKSPQIDTAQHYLDDNFSDVMRSSALRSNASSLFNTTTCNTTHSEQKVTLDWILLDGKNSQLETLRDKHIADFPAPGGNTGEMLCTCQTWNCFIT